MLNEKYAMNNGLPSTVESIGSRYVRTFFLSLKINYLNFEWMHKRTYVLHLNFPATIELRYAHIYAWIERIIRIYQNKKERKHDEIDIFRFCITHSSYNILTQ